MGLATAELYNNLGLCCFYAQQYDMTITCLQRALHIAEDQETLAEVWYNVGHLSLGIGDVNLAYQCFKLALTANHDHAESYNNIGVLEMRKGKVNQLLVTEPKDGSIQILGNQNICWLEETQSKLGLKSHIARMKT